MPSAEEFARLLPRLGDGRFEEVGRAMGGPFARERVARLFDDGSFAEDGLLIELQ